MLLNPAGAGRRQHLGARRRGRVLLPPARRRPQTTVGTGQPNGGCGPAQRPGGGVEQRGDDRVEAQGVRQRRGSRLQRGDPGGGVLGGGAGGLQLALVPQPLPRTGDGGPREPALRAGHRTEEDRQAARGPPQLERDLVEAPLHVQQRREVRLPVDARADREDLLQAQAPKLGAARPTHEKIAFASRRPVEVEREQAAGESGRFVPTGSRRSRAGSPAWPRPAAGALRFGQWPVASSRTNSLSFRRACTYSPPLAGR